MSLGGFHSPFGRELNLKCAKVESELVWLERQPGLHLWWWWLGSHNCIDEDDMRETAIFALMIIAEDNDGDDILGDVTASWFGCWWLWLIDNDFDLCMYLWSW